MDPRLKVLMQELGIAINESLSDSDSIAEAIEKIKEAGYDVFLVLEATVGFSKLEDNLGGQSKVHSEQPLKNGEVNFTPQDEKFLRALKIDLKDL